MGFFFLLVPVFCAGYYFSELFFWLPWVGFAGLCYLYQVRRRGHFWKDFLLPCWGSFLIIDGICFQWILLHDEGVYVLAVLILALFFPFLFLLHHLITSKVRWMAAEVAAAFGIFFALEFLLARFPIVEPVALDIFFPAPVQALAALRYVDFRVWCACVFSICFATAFSLNKKNMRSWVFTAALVCSLGALVVCAHTQNAPAVKTPGRSVKIALIQHNLPYPDDWRVAHWPEIKAKYRQMTSQASLGSPDLIVFPLYSVPGDVYRKPEFLKELALLARCPILVAAHVPIKAGDDAFEQGFMNLAFLYAPDGTVRDIYQAVESLPFLGQEVKTSGKYRVIQSPFGKLGVLLCFEETIPRLAREASREGAVVLVSLSNPGAFQGTMKPKDLLFQAQVRAAETGLPLVRVAANGYSALIDRVGNVAQKTQLNAEAVLQVELSGLDHRDAAGEGAKNPLLDEVVRSIDS